MYIFSKDGPRNDAVSSKHEGDFVFITSSLKYKSVQITEQTACAYLL